MPDNLELENLIMYNRELHMKNEILRHKSVNISFFTLEILEKFKRLWNINKKK